MNKPFCFRTKILFGALVVGFLNSPHEEIGAQGTNQRSTIYPSNKFVSSKTIQSSIGLNKPDLFQQYLGRAGGGFTSPAYQKVSQAMAKKAIIDAKNIGVTYFRISATGYLPAGYDIPGDLDLWVENPTEYWNLFDQMMNDLMANGIKIVPVFVWNWTQFPAMTHEKIIDMMTNPESESFKLLTKYIADFIQHYKEHPMLYFYELTNELNLGADLDLVASCQNENPYPELCLPISNFSTDQMIAFTDSLANYIKSLDSNHLISSGFSLPRPAAEHIRRYPGWLPGGPDWTPDSIEELQKNLAEIHTGLDIISIHLYNGGDHERFGVIGKTNADLLNIVKQIADSLEKHLYIGEFGDVSPFINQDPNALFTQSVLNKIVELNIPFSSPWVWEFYQFASYLTYDNPNTFYNIEPGYTDLIIEKIKEANTKLGNSIPPIQSPDTTAPQVVLTWPLERATMDSMQLIHAVASDNNGHILKVEFWIDQKLQDTVSIPPYQILFDTTPLTSGEYEIEAIAYDPSGNLAKYTTNAIHVGSVPTGIITAAPNPCILQPNEVLCTTTISWKMYANPLKMNAHVYVSMDGNPATSMSCGALIDSADAPWIQANHMYEFLLYADSTGCTDDNRGILLASATVTALVTSVEQIGHETPTDFRLSQNYPNPFNPTTTISFDLPKANYVTLKVYNTIGEELMTLISDNLQAGKYKIKFNGVGLASGVYLYKIHAGSFIESRKMLLVR